MKGHYGRSSGRDLWSGKPSRTGGGAVLDLVTHLDDVSHRSKLLCAGGMLFVVWFAVFETKVVKF